MTSHQVLSVAAAFSIFYLKKNSIKWFSGLTSIILLDVCLKWIIMNTSVVYQSQNVNGIVIDNSVLLTGIIDVAFYLLVIYYIYHYTKIKVFS